jgi:hypothetical protein
MRNFIPFSKIRSYSQLLGYFTYLKKRGEAQLWYNHKHLSRFLLQSLLKTGVFHFNRGYLLKRLNKTQQLSIQTALN